jgi:hypothetical protein
MALAQGAPTRGEMMSASYGGRYLFIMGCPRSGTTASWRLLTSHRAIVLGVERYARRSERPEFLEPSLFERERFFQLMPGDAAYKDPAAVTPNLADLMARYDAATYRGDKIPTLYKSLPRLLATFGSSLRVLMIFRNIFDVADSYRRRADNPEDVEWWWRTDSAVLQWNEAIEASHAHSADPRILLVQYEQLFQAGRGVKALFSFLDLELTDGVVAAYRRLLKQSATLDAGRSRSLTHDEINYIRQHADFPGYRDVLDRCRQSRSDDVTEPERVAEGSPA